MAKRGKTNHIKRIAAPAAIPIHDKKKNVWLISGSPGPHKKSASLPLVVLLRDILGFAKDAREARSILAHRLVEVDGKVRTDPKFCVGLMDVVSFPKADAYFRVIVGQKGRLALTEISKEEATKKIEKILSKHSYKGKIVLHFHDGKNIILTSTAKIGDSVVVSLPSNKPEKILRLEKGARCLITEGKHAGTIAQLEELIEQRGRRKEAKLSTPEGEFITVAEYLHVVDENFKGVA